MDFRRKVAYKAYSSATRYYSAELVAHRGGMECMVSGRYKQWWLDSWDEPGFQGISELYRRCVVDRNRQYLSCKLFLFGETNFPFLSGLRGRCYKGFDGFDGTQQALEGAGHLPQPAW